ncbi:MAG: HU family DNA-binding protein [Clostridia bacterium]|nr:HU family DNA-binding protein [Clostridia bacterium]
MNKATFIKHVAEKAGISKKEAEVAVNATFGTIAENLGDGIVIPGFGSFGVKERAARQGVNPATKEKIEIPASIVPYFKPAKALKDMWKTTIEE